MGKKSDGPSIHSRMLLGGYDRELERYGVEGPRHGRTDRGGDGYRSAEDVEKDLIAAARNDYDLRRTVEAAAMSGKGKAQSIRTIAGNALWKLLSSTLGNLFSLLRLHHTCGALFN